jgi:predicted ribosomally synthesized peptide with nif11-like leader
MSEDQLTALLAKLKDDAGLRKKLRGAGDLDAAVAIAKEAGFDANKEEWLKYLGCQSADLSDFELEAMAGGARKEDRPETDGNSCTCVDLGCVPHTQRAGCPSA